MLLRCPRISKLSLLLSPMVPEDWPALHPCPSLTIASANNHRVSHWGTHSHHWHWLQSKKSYRDHFTVPIENQSQSALPNKHFTYIYMKKKNSLWKPIHNIGRCDFSTRCRCPYKYTRNMKKQWNMMPQKKQQFSIPYSDKKRKSMKCLKHNLK